MFLKKSGNVVLVPHLSCTSLVRAFADQSSCFFGGHQHLDGHAHRPRLRRSTTWHPNTMTKHRVFSNSYFNCFLKGCRNLWNVYKLCRRHSIICHKWHTTGHNRCMLFRLLPFRLQNTPPIGPSKGLFMVLSLAMTIKHQPCSHPTPLQWQLPRRCSGQQFLQARW